MRVEYSHVTFSDESSWNTGRFRSIGMVSASRISALSLHQELRQVFADSQVDELKWQKVRTAKYRFAATKVIDSCAQRLSSNLIRIDVLVWDSRDIRHSVARPDLVANLQIMYYHLFRNVMSRRWPSDCIWRHIPDEHTGIDWRAVQDYLSRKDKHLVSELTPQDEDEDLNAFSWRLRRLFRVHEITECRSQEMCLTQVADLFAGIGAFSRESYVGYRAWRANRGYSAGLFAEADPAGTSSGLAEKYSVMDHLETKVRQMALEISLDSSRGFRTMNPRLPLNFWWYEPQSVHDKAPGA